MFIKNMFSFIKSDILSELFILFMIGFVGILTQFHLLRGTGFEVQLESSIFERFPKNEPEPNRQSNSWKRTSKLMKGTELLNPS